MTAALGCNEEQMEPSIWFKALWWECFYQGKWPHLKRTWCHYIMPPCYASITSGSILVIKITPSKRKCLDWRMTLTILTLKWQEDSWLWRRKTMDAGDTEDEGKEQLHARPQRPNPERSWPSHDCWGDTRTSPPAKTRWRNCKGQKSIADEKLDFRDFKILLFYKLQ